METPQGEREEDPRLEGSGRHGIDKHLRLIHKTTITYLQPKLITKVLSLK